MKKIISAFIILNVIMLSSVSNAKEITINSQNIKTLDELISFVLKKSYKPLLKDPRVKNTLNIVGDITLSNKSEALLLIQDQLLLIDHILIEKEHYFLVLRTQTAFKEGHFNQLDQYKNNVGFITMEFKLNNIKASNIVATLRPLVSKVSEIKPDLDNNSVIITDTISNQNRFKKLIEALDK